MRLQPDGHCDDWAVRFDAWYSLPWHALAPNVKPVQYCLRPLGPPNHLSSSNGQRLLCARGAPPNIHGAPSGLRARQSCRRCRALVRLPAARAGPTCTLGKRRGRRSTLPCDPRTPVAREGAQPSGGDMPRARRPESPHPSWARGARAAQPQSTASRLSSVGCIRLCWEARRTNAPGARTGHAPPHPHRASQRACRETGPTITNNSSCGYRMEPRVMSGRFAHTLLAHMCFGAPRVAYHRMAAAATRPARSHGSARRRARARGLRQDSARGCAIARNQSGTPPAHTQTGRARPGTCRGPRRWKPGNRTMPAGTAAEERGASVAGQRCVRPPRRHQWCHGCDAWTTIRPSAI